MEAFLKIYMTFLYNLVISTTVQEMENIQHALDVYINSISKETEELKYSSEMLRGLRDEFVNKRLRKERRRIETNDV